MTRRRKINHSLGYVIFKSSSLCCPNWCSISRYRVLRQSYCTSGGKKHALRVKAQRKGKLTNISEIAQEILTQANKGGNLPVWSQPGYKSYKKHRSSQKSSFSSSNSLVINNAAMDL
jgi:hypothetical protein